MDELSNSQLLHKLEALVIKNSEDIKSVLKSVDEKLTERLDKLEEKYNDIKTTVENKIIKIERQKRKNNIIIFGVQHNKDLISFVTNDLSKLLKMSISQADINNIYRVGTANNVIVEFTSYLKKLKVLEHARNLKNSGFSVNHDLHPKDQADAKILYERMKTARALNLKAYIKNFKLHINNEVYGIDNLPNLENILLQQTENNTPIGKELKENKREEVLDKNLKRTNKPKKVEQHSQTARNSANIATRSRTASVKSSSECSLSDTVEIKTKTVK